MNTICVFFCCHNKNLAYSLLYKDPNSYRNDNLFHMVALKALFWLLLTVIQSKRSIAYIIRKAIFQGVGIEILYLISLVDKDDSSED